MKRWVVFLLISLLLCGCGQEETLETIADEMVQSVMAQPREISLRLPEDTVAPVLQSDSEQVYLCENHEIILETLSSGDLNATVQSISGYDKAHVTLVQTQQEDVTRYEFVWVSAGENGDRLGRAVILDDGNYHYCMSVLRDAAGAEEEKIVWNEVFRSFTLL